MLKATAAAAASVAYPRPHWSGWSLQPTSTAGAQGSSACTLCSPTMPTKAGPPTTSTAQSPQPSRASSSLMKSTVASLCVRVGDDPSDSTTAGWVFSV